ncbi:hypothetical protein ACFVVA_17260 [Kitasatospora sp. NPDC058048]|uniref:hypothetical protein n=1 Tax=Kitasatospora sp. NPDC058048 TaxID=3346313 RepID=UPI0036DDF614
MTLTKTQRDAVWAAIEGRRQSEEEFSRLLRHASREEWRRRAEAAFPERAQAQRRLLELAGIDTTKLDRQGRRDDSWARSFLEVRRANVVGRSKVVAERQARETEQHAATVAKIARAARPIPALGNGPLQWQETANLETASEIRPTPFITSEDTSFDSEVVQMDPLNNRAKVYANMSTDYGDNPDYFSVFRLDFMFEWLMDRPLLLNAITYVQPNGSYFLEGDWPLGSGELSYSTILLLYSYSPDGAMTELPAGDAKAPVVAGVSSGFWDSYTDKSGLISNSSFLADRNLSFVDQGSTAVFIVRVELVLGAQDSGQAEFDFKTGESGINVPQLVACGFTLP